MVGIIGPGGFHLREVELDRGLFVEFLVPFSWVIGKGRCVFHDFGVRVAYWVCFQQKIRQGHRRDDLQQILDNICTFKKHGSNQLLQNFFLHGIASMTYLQAYRHI